MRPTRKNELDAETMEALTQLGISAVAVVLAIVFLVGFAISGGVKEMGKTKEYRDAEARMAMVRAEQAQLSTPAVVMRNTLLQIGIGIGGIIFCIGGAAILLLSVSKKSNLIQPSKNGAFPLVQKGGVLIDPNRNLEPVTVVSGTTVQFQGNGSEYTKARLATQAQAISLMTAAQTVLPQQNNDAKANAYKLIEEQDTLPAIQIMPKEVEDEILQLIDE